MSQPTAREELGALLVGLSVKAHAQSFNARWKTQAEREKSGAPEYFTGIIKAYALGYISNDV